MDNKTDYISSMLIDTLFDVEQFCSIKVPVSYFEESQTYKFQISNQELEVPTNWGVFRDLKREKPLIVNKLDDKEFFEVVSLLMGQRLTSIEFEITSSTLKMLKAA